MPSKKGTFNLQYDWRLLRFLRSDVIEQRLVLTAYQPASTALTAGSRLRQALPGIESWSLNNSI